MKSFFAIGKSPWELSHSISNDAILNLLNLSLVIDSIYLIFDLTSYGLNSLSSSSIVSYSVIRIQPDGFIPVLCINFIIGGIFASYKHESHFCILFFINDLIFVFVVPILLL